MGALPFDITAISPGWWLAGVSVLFVAVASGFAAGFACARWSERRAFERARNGVAQLFQTVLKTLDGAREVCGLLEKHPGQFLRPDQTTQLEQRRGGLVEALSRIIRRHRPDPPESAAEQPPPPARINWLRSPVDATNELPDRSAFEANLKSLLELARATGKDSGLLLIRVDKMTGLVSRFGQSSADQLLKRLAGLVCRSVHDDDLVCRCNAE